MPSGIAIGPSGKRRPVVISVNSGVSSRTSGMALMLPKLHLVPPAEPCHASSMSYDTIRSSTIGAITTITLDRPDQLNAWTPHMAEELADAIGRANDDPAVGAIIMTGAGRGFCAGADMNAVFGTRLSGTDPGNDTAGGSGGMPAGIDWVQLIRDSKPVVAAIHGAAVGIGITMVLPADAIVATVDAKIGVVFIKVGLVPELASTHFLVQRVGWGRPRICASPAGSCAATRLLRCGSSTTSSTTTTR